MKTITESPPKIKLLRGIENFELLQYFTTEEQEIFKTLLYRGNVQDSEIPKAFRSKLIHFEAVLKMLSGAHELNNNPDNQKSGMTYPTRNIHDYAKYV